MSPKQQLYVVLIINWMIILGLRHFHQPQYLCDLVVVIVVSCWTRIAWIDESESGKKRKVRLYRVFIGTMVLLGLAVTMKDFGLIHVTDPVLYAIGVFGLSVWTYIFFGFRTPKSTDSISGTNAKQRRLFLDSLGSETHTYTLESDPNESDDGEPTAYSKRLIE